jgi:hypothetical protein
MWWRRVVVVVAAADGGGNVNNGKMAATVVWWWRRGASVFLFLCFSKMFAVTHDKENKYHLLDMYFLCRAPACAQQRQFVVPETKGARQSLFTVQKGDVWPLPCTSGKNTRQRLCRAHGTHGKGSVSRSACMGEVVTQCGSAPIVARARGATVLVGCWLAGCSVLKYK